MTRNPSRDSSTHGDNLYMEDNYLLYQHPSGDEKSSPEDVPELTLDEIKKLLPEIADTHIQLNVTLPQPNTR